MSHKDLYERLDNMTRIFENFRDLTLDRIGATNLVVSQLEKKMNDIWVSHTQ